MPDPDQLTRLETELAQQRTLLVAIRDLVERLAMQLFAMQHTLLQQGEQLSTLQQTLDALNDMQA
jgi:predicted  nucleic acid-binding Zn-ribbon protein